jgi:hydroxymethylpyrimidine kinase/phosphomethylpyrimidine kinase
MRNILTIAGYDPSSGAGIVRDMDTFFSLGIHGLSIPTCTVVQGPQGVTGVYRTPMKEFRELIALIGRGLPLHGVKVGVGCDASYIREIAELLENRNIPLVIDPVMAAKNGTKLVTESGLKTLIKRLFPLATVVTPNIDEASRLSGVQITTIDDMKEAARSIFKTGPKAVIIKGGHLKGNPVDVLYDGIEFSQWKKKRINRVVHGTGCSFSSLIVSFLVLGYTLKDAFFASEDVVEEALKASYRIDKKGYFYMSTGIMNHLKVTHKLETIRP